MGVIYIEVTSRSVFLKQIVIQQIQFKSILHSIKPNLVCILFDLEIEK